MHRVLAKPEGGQALSSGLTFVERVGSRLMGNRRLRSGAAFWRPSDQMNVLNTELAKPLAAADPGAGLRRLSAGSALARDRRVRPTELYVASRRPHRVGR